MLPALARGETRRAEERSTRYRGSARVRLECLYFEDGELDLKNLERLKSCISKDCRRLEPYNHVPAVINQQLLSSALETSNLPAEALLRSDCPELVLPTGCRLECLHGRHRIQAAKEVLPLTQKWWVIDLYLSNVSHDLKTSLIEEYANEERPADGEVYRKIRQYHFSHNLALERRWWTRLTPHGAKSLKQLLRNDVLTAAFDDLLKVPGLWDGMRISTLHKLLAIRCDEEILRYLGFVEEFWSSLLEGDETELSKIDRDTVKALELRAPGASSSDAAFVHEQIMGGKAFGAFNEEKRRMIWNHIRTFEGIIPSLYTFFEDAKYLEVCFSCIKRLVSIGPRDTISTALERAYSGGTQNSGQAIIQISESTSVQCPADLYERVDIGRRQLCIFAMRNYLCMPKEPKGKDIVARVTFKADKGTLRRFADLAEQMSFKTPEIEALKQLTPSLISPGVSEPVDPILGTTGSGERLKLRCGLPSVETYDVTRDFLFMPHLHGSNAQQAEGITSFFVRRWVYLMFFGKLDLSTILGRHVSGGITQAEQENTEREAAGREAAERIAQRARERQRVEEAARVDTANTEFSNGEIQLANDERRRQEEENLFTDIEDLQVSGVSPVDYMHETTELQNTNTREVEPRPQSMVKHTNQARDSLSAKVLIRFKVREQDSWRDLHSISIDPFDPSEVDRTAKRYVAQGFRLLNTELRLLIPQDCYEAVVSDKTCTILLLPGGVIDISYSLWLSAMEVHDDAHRQELRLLKRIA